MRVPNPGHYQLAHPGAYDGNQLVPNCLLICDNVQLEELKPNGPDDAGQTHLLIGGEGTCRYDDDTALYPKLCFTNCDQVCLYLGGCVASVFLDRCAVNLVTAKELRGELVFRDCHLQPDVTGTPDALFQVESELGTRFASCTVHAPIVDGEPRPDIVNRLGILSINESLRHSHLNTMLSNEIVAHLKGQGIALTPEFVARLACHYDTSRTGGFDQT
jgi:hypothetical protein